MPTGVKRKPKPKPKPKPKTLMKKTPVKDLLQFTYNEGEVYNTEAPFRAIKISVEKRLIVADKLDENGVAIRFKLTPLGYDLAEKTERKQQAIQEKKDREQWAMLQFCSDGVC